MHIVHYLILSHFIADYLFQPNWLAKYKRESFGGLVTHGVLIWFTMVVTLTPYLAHQAVWYAITVIAGVHLVLDHIKIRLGGKTGLNSRTLYLLDQFFHLAAIVAVGLFWIGDLAPVELTPDVALWYRNPWLMAYLITLVLATYVYDVTRYAFTRELKKLDYERDYAGMIWRGAVVTFGFLAAFILTK